jgi:anti-anti-sigma factor
MRGTTEAAPPWQLEITATTDPAGIRLRGEVGATTMPMLELALEVLADRAADATLDLRELVSIDIRGLRALARAAIRLRSAGRCLRLRGAGRRVRHMLGVLGWSELFEHLP